MIRQRASLFSGVLALLAAVAFALPSSAAAQSNPSAPKEIKVIARRYRFVPKTITVAKGETVRLVVTSEDVDHGLAIQEFGVEQMVKAKQTKTIEFTPNKEGRFRFYCSTFCGDGHPDMAGELIVTRPAASASSVSSSDVKVSFDENAAGVVIVESGGKRLRIDTTAKTVTEMDTTQSERPRQAAAPAEEQKSRPAAEPYDYRLVNVPTPKRVPKHSLGVYFTHRFQQPVKPEGVDHGFGDRIENLFGLDSGSVSSLGFMYGITDRLYATAYRSPVTQKGMFKTIELGLGYHLLDETGSSPIAMSAYASVEGNHNFTEEYTLNLQAMFARSVTKYVNLFFSPAAHINSNGSSRFNPDIPGTSFKLGQHTGSFGFGVNARIRPSASLLFEYTPRVGFKLGILDFDRNMGLKYKSEAELGFGIEKRIGRHSFSLTFSNTQATTTSRYNSSNQALSPGRFAIGFNLYRRLL